MNKVTITLELTYKEVAEVMALLHINSQTPNKVPLEPLVSKQDETPIQQPTKPVTKPTAGKTVKMPTFGRNQQQITAFEEKEKARMLKKTDAALLKEQKEEERRSHEEAEQSALNAMLNKRETKTVSTLPKKPWDS